MMKINDLKLVLDQYDDNSLIYVEITAGTSYRLDKMIIKPSIFGDDYTPVKNAYKHEVTNSLILTVE
jgi:hypothetical protein